MLPFDSIAVLALTAEVRSLPRNGVWGIANVVDQMFFLGTFTRLASHVSGRDVCVKGCSRSSGSGM